MYLDGLDELDRKIVRLLIENARISYIREVANEF